MGLNLEKISGTELKVNDQVLVDSNPGYQTGYITQIKEGKIKVDDRPKDPNNMRTFLLSFLPGSGITPFTRGIEYDLNEVELYKINKEA